MSYLIFPLLVSSIIGSKLASRSPHFKMTTNQSLRNRDVITQEHQLAAGGSSGVCTQPPWLTSLVDGGCSLVLPCP